MTLAERIAKRQPTTCVQCGEAAPDLRVHCCPPVWVREARAGKLAGKVLDGRAA